MGIVCLGAIAVMVGTAVTTFQARRYFGHWGWAVLAAAVLLIFLAYITAKRPEAIARLFTSGLARKGRQGLVHDLLVTLQRFYFDPSVRAFLFIQTAVILVATSLLMTTEFKPACAVNAASLAVCNENPYPAGDFGGSLARTLRFLLLDFERAELLTREGKCVVILLLLFNLGLVTFYVMAVRDLLNRKFRRHALKELPRNLPLQGHVVMAGPGRLLRQLLDEIRHAKAWTQDLVVVAPDLDDRTFSRVGHIYDSVWGVHGKVHDPEVIRAIATDEAGHAIIFGEIPLPEGRADSVQERLPPGFRQEDYYINTDITLTAIRAVQALNASIRLGVVFPREVEREVERDDAEPRARHKPAPLEVISAGHPPADGSDDLRRIRLTRGDFVLLSDRLTRVASASEAGKAALGGGKGTELKRQIISEPVLKTFLLLFREQPIQHYHRNPAGDTYIRVTCRHPKSSTGSIRPYRVGFMGPDGRWIPPWSENPGERCLAVDLDLEHLPKGLHLPLSRAWARAWPGVEKRGPRMDPVPADRIRARRIRARAGEATTMAYNEVRQQILESWTKKILPDGATLEITDYKASRSIHENASRLALQVIEQSIETLEAHWEKRHRPAAARRLRAYFNASKGALGRRLLDIDPLLGDRELCHDCLGEVLSHLESEARHHQVLRDLERCLAPRFVPIPAISSVEEIAAVLLSKHVTHGALAAHAAHWLFPKILLRELRPHGGYLANLYRLPEGEATCLINPDVEKGAAEIWTLIQSLAERGITPLGFTGRINTSLDDAINEEERYHQLIFLGPWPLIPVDEQGPKDARYEITGVVGLAGEEDG